MTLRLLSTDAATQYFTSLAMHELGPLPPPGLARSRYNFFQAAVYTANHDLKSADKLRKTTIYRKNAVCIELEARAALKELKC
jgi:hypothetical protein